MKSMISLILITLFSIEGCHPKEANQALDRASYSIELEKCLNKGKAAHSYEVYEKCADAVDDEWKRNGTSKRN